MMALLSLLLLLPDSPPRPDSGESSLTGLAAWAALLDQNLRTVLRDPSPWGLGLLVLVALGSRVVYLHFAGPILRGTADHWTRAPRPPRSKHYRFARTKLRSLVTPPLLLLAGTALLFGLSWGLGLWGRVPYIGPWILILLSPFAVFFALAAVTLLLGILWSTPMMAAAIAIEGRGAVDAFSRAYHYSLGHPLQYGLLSLRGLLCAVLGAGARFVVVGLALLFSSAALRLSLSSELYQEVEVAFWSLFGFWHPGTFDDSIEPSAAAWVIGGLGVALLLSPLGHLLGHRLSQQVVTYLTLREKTDRTPAYAICADPGSEAPEGSNSVTAESIGLKRIR